MQFIPERLGTKMKTISPYNIGSLKTETNIRTISEMIAKQFTSTGKIYTNYLQTCTYAYNSFLSPELNVSSPFQLTFGRLTKIVLEIETKPQEGRNGSLGNAMNYAENERMVQD